jgi:acyl dehydratase
MTGRYFDDFRVGERFAARGVTVSEEQIKSFALDYDPQPFHLDAEAAAESHFGGLIASGFQTLALAWTSFYREGVIAACSMGSPGIDKLRWVRPVRPGDTLSTGAEVRELRPSGSRPDRGFLTMAYEVANQDGETVMSFVCVHILARRRAEQESR